MVPLAMVNDSYLKTRKVDNVDKPKIPSDVANPPFYLPLRSLSSRYRVVNELGNGSFGSVCLAKSVNSLVDPVAFKAFKNTLMERTADYQYENAQNKRTGIVAIKTMTKRLNLLNDYVRVKEVRFILSLPYHRNLVQVYEMFIDNIDFRLHISMECMDQNLYLLMKSRKSNKFSEPTLKSILAQILNGIRHIHRHDFFHRDIKPENILVSPSNRYYEHSQMYSDFLKTVGSFVVKLADFGLARHVENKRPYTSYVSTRWYRAPEILLRKNSYSRPVDVWAFGSVAAEIAMFRPLFPGHDELDQTWKVLHFLGTPNSSNKLADYFPSYGYWDNAEDLFHALGISMPEVPCIDIATWISAPSLQMLCDVIRLCLTWNPDKRATIDTICQMPYFKDTCVDDYVRPQIAIGTECSSYTSKKLFNFDQSERFAGIQSSPKVNIHPVQRDQDFHSHHDITDFATVGSSISPAQTDCHSFSLLKDNLINSSIQKSPSLSDFGLKDSLNDIGSFDGIIPSLSNGDTQTNDENLNTRSTPKPKLLNESFREILKIQPSQNVTSNIDPSLSEKAYQAIPPEYGTHIDINSVYQGRQNENFYSGLTCYDQQLYASFGTEPLLSDTSSKNIGFDSRQFFTNDLGSMLDAEGLENEHPPHHSLASNDDFFAMFEQGITEGQESNNQPEGDTYQPEKEPNFSESLYSNFSLRQHPHG